MNELQPLYAIERVLPQLKFNISYPIFLSPLSHLIYVSPSLSGDKNRLNIKTTAACRQTGHHIRSRRYFQLPPAGSNYSHASANCPPSWALRSDPRLHNRPAVLDFSRDYGITCDSRRPKETAVERKVKATVDTDFLSHLRTRILEEYFQSIFDQDWFAIRYVKSLTNDKWAVSILQYLDRQTN